MKSLSVGQTEHAKNTPVQSEHILNAFAVRQVRERGADELYAQAPILRKHGSNAGKIGLAQRNNLERTAVERGQKFLERLWIGPQKPRRLGNHRPTGQEWSSDVAKLLDTGFMMLVGFDQNGNDRAGIDQNLTSQASPKPSKCRGFVLKSRMVALDWPNQSGLFRMFVCGRGTSLGGKL